MYIFTIGGRVRFRGVLHPPIRFLSRVVSTSSTRPPVVLYYFIAQSIPVDRARDIFKPYTSDLRSFIQLKTGGKKHTPHTPSITYTARAWCTRNPLFCFVSTRRPPSAPCFASYIIRFVFDYICHVARVCRRRKRRKNTNRKHDPTPR